MQSNEHHLTRPSLSKHERELWWPLFQNIGPDRAVSRLVTPFYFPATVVSVWVTSPDSTEEQRGRLL